MSDVLRIVKELNPLCVTVTGRPRTPSDQGDIERTHRDIRKVLNKCICDARSRLTTKEDRQFVTWTSQLPNVMSVMNNTKYNKKKVVPYEIVFGGRKFDDPMYAELQGKSLAEILSVEEMCTHLSVISTLTKKCQSWGYIESDGDKLDGQSNNESISNAVSTINSKSEYLPSFHFHQMHI